MTPKGLALDLAEDEALTSGQGVLVAGNPGIASDFATTTLTVSTDPVGEAVPATFQIEDHIEKGNDGGPVLTRSGEVAGVLTEMIPEESTQIAPVVHGSQNLRETVAQIMASPQPVEADCSAERVYGPKGWQPTVAQHSWPTTYGDGAFLDGKQDRCESGEAVACDDLFMDSPYGSDYEAFATTCGEGASRASYGSCARDRVQRLLPLCKDGQLSRCDDLEDTLGLGADPETSQVARSCGGRYEQGTGPCVDRDQEIAKMEDLESECTGGDMGACDDLAETAREQLAEVARTCGGRFPLSYEACVGRAG